MRVVCMRLEDGRTGDGESDGWLSVGEQYVVLAIETDVRSQKSADRVAFRIGDKRGGAPGLLSASLFGVLDGALPGVWRAVVNERGNLEIGPTAWLRPGYWERLFDSDPEAMRDFDAGVREIAMGQPARLDPTR
jgi:hypothetical protein